MINSFPRRLSYATVGFGLMNVKDIAAISVPKQTFIADVMDGWMATKSIGEKVPTSFFNQGENRRRRATQS